MSQLPIKEICCNEHWLFVLLEGSNQLYKLDLRANSASRQENKFYKVTNEGLGED